MDHCWLTGCGSASLTTPRMHAKATAEVTAADAGEARRQPMSGIPYKVYAYYADRADAGLAAFAAHSAQAAGCGSS